MRQNNTTRPGFTLIELLVVIGVIVVLAGLVIYFGPGISKGERAARGASDLQGKLFSARQQALRNRMPYGIRLLRDSNDPANPGFFVARSFQFISQPLDYRRGSVQSQATTDIVLFNGPDLTGGLADPALWLVQPGDALQVGNEPATLIKEVNRPGDPPNTVRTNAPNGAVAFDTDDYRVFRAARPAPGEEVVRLPEDIIIDLRDGFSELVWEAPPTNHAEILFAPSGRVLNSAGRVGRIVLWVRDETADVATSSEQSLIVVLTRSGNIASVPVDVGGSDPKAFLKDPRTYGGM